VLVVCRAVPPRRACRSRLADGGACWAARFVLSPGRVIVGETSSARDRVEADRPRTERAALRARVLSALLVAAPAAGVLLGGFARRWMDDDGFINLRIVRNLLHGAGPVFNVGERVEAGTSPLWIGLLAILGGLGIRLEHAAVFTGIALAVAGVVLAEDGASRLNERPDERLHDSGPRSLAERLTATPLPVGAAIVAALPPVWDYASSGLETALALAWLGASFDAMARWRGRSSGRSDGDRWGREAMLVGIGPLIRPELALYSLAFVVPLVRSAMGARSGWRRLARIASIALWAGAVPLAYQIFRMGYYASTMPNTGVAKEAFSANWHQGRVYFDNFFRTYAMVLPLTAAAILWIGRLRDHAAARRPTALDLSVGLPVAAAVHAVYIVRLGGDYMHGRLFVPLLFAALMPIMVIPVPAASGALARVLAGAPIAAIAVWAIVCASALRIGVENVANIGDERGWYAREAHVANPISLESYRAHFFYGGAQKHLDQTIAGCPGPATARGSPGNGACRRVYLDEDDPQIAPAPRVSPLADDVDPRVRAVVSEGAIGISGYLFPADVHLVDRHGLAEPIVARFELGERGRPGHEKRISAAWLLARFAEPAGDDDLSVVAARHALHCGALASLEQAITGPLTPRAFIANVGHAWSFARLRIPHDPFDAESRFCGTPPMLMETTGGGGGTAFRWRCPAGSSIAGLRGTFKAQDGAVSHVQPLCGSDAARDATRSKPGDAAGAAFEGPTFGEKASTPFEVACPGEARAVGLYGTSDNLVRSVGLVCSRNGVSTRTSLGGAARGASFGLACPGGGAVLGVSGRAGSLIDSLGVLCAGL
jgi:arabinofuranosyltransferase